MPQFGGFCANGINYAVPWGAGGGPNTWRIYRGRLYVFGGQELARPVRDGHRAQPRARAHRLLERGGGRLLGALLTRLKRLVLRVPHYQTDKALQAEYEAARSRRRSTLPVMPGAAQVVPAR